MGRLKIGEKRKLKMSMIIGKGKVPRQYFKLKNACLNTFRSSPHLSFIIGFICALFVSRSDSEFKDLHADRINLCFYHYGS